MNNNYPDSLTIQQYLDGKLDPEMMHQLEKQAMDDPFLWEALEGYAHTADPGAGLSILQRQLHERIVHMQENKKVFDLTWQRLSVAAAAAVLFISAGILFWMNSPRPNSELVSNQKQVEVKLMDLDSISTYPDQIVQPRMGWQLYRQYLDQNTRHPKNEPLVKGAVLLSFQVRKDGRIRDIKVIKGLNDAYNAEAIRLIKAGPSWKGAADGLIKEVRLEIVF